MDIYLDNAPLDVPVGPLGRMLDSARSTLPEAGRMIVEVRLDGEALSSEQLEQQATVEPTAEEVQFITAAPAQLAREALHEVADALNRAVEQQQQAAEALQQDRTQEAMDPLREVIRIWSQTQQAVVQSAALLGVDLDAMSLDADTPPDLIAATGEHLRAVRDQMQQQDWLALADTLGYDLAELVPRWHALLEALGQRAGESTG